MLLEQFGIAVLQGNGGGGINEILLVARHQHRSPAMLEELDDEGVAAPGRLTAIHKQQHQVDFTDGTAGTFDQPLAPISGEVCGCQGCPAAPAGRRGW